MITSCAHCDSADLKPHCPGPACPWKRCNACHAVNGFAYGVQKAMGWTSDVPPQR